MDLSAVVDQANLIKTSAEDVPHYQLPNFSSILPEYTNAEQDYVKGAFSTGNFSSITKVPNNIKPTEVSKMRNSMMYENRKATVPVPAVKKPASGLFLEFEYVPSRYSLADELKARERLDKEAKRLNVAGRDFRCSSTAVKLKHEDAFEDKEYRYPYMSEPFDSASDRATRQRWLDNTKVLHGPFLPGGTSKTKSTRPTRAMMPDLLKELHDLLKEDWEDHDFDVLATEDDNIAIRFGLLSIDSEKGLLAYMNVLSNSHRTVEKFGLSKVVEDWNTKPGDGFLYYMFRPPWTAARGLDSFYSLHPEERNFHTSRAGQSFAKRVPKQRGR